MTRTISYKEIIKLIHPDTNPDIVNPSDKINTVRLYRKNELMLYTFGVEWGVIKEQPKETITRSWMNTKPKPDPRTYILRGDIVYIKTLDIQSKCVKVTPKRVYFRKQDGKITFCNKSNARRVI